MKNKKTARKKTIAKPETCVCSPPRKICGMNLSAERGKRQALASGKKNGSQKLSQNLKHPLTRHPERFGHEKRQALALEKEETACKKNYPKIRNIRLLATPKDSGHEKRQALALGKEKRLAKNYRKT